MTNPFRKFVSMFPHTLQSLHKIAPV